ncbi:sensor histidine kinase [Palleronia abyssalis]|uniref:histidine kinase n=1 Tax=Palleronia abyssalis TaxID=1501240 RepID=A0A2R8BT16_9RHOB|nr:HAMP domain-containing sensor histidine kinase [Palleronia abyssalis]SPJ23337.1 Signal transduction histidine-protein kinase BarA [Palleronia abyssalis]
MEGRIKSGEERPALPERPYLRRRVATAMIVLLVPLVLSSVASVAYHRTSAINARYAVAFSELLGRISHLDREVARAESGRDEDPEIWREEFISALGLFSAIRAADPDGGEIMDTTGDDDLQPLMRRKVDVGLDPFELSVQAGLAGYDMPDSLKKVWEAGPEFSDSRVSALEKKFGEILIAAAPILLDGGRDENEFAQYWAASTEISHRELEGVSKVLQESSRVAGQAPVVLACVVLVIALMGVAFAWMAVIRPLIKRVGRIQRALAREAVAAHAADRAKTEFLASVSHELRTPMNGIIGGIQLLEASDLSESDRETVQIMSDCAESQMLLIEQLLTFGEIEAGVVRPVTSPVDLAKVVRDALGSVALNAYQKGLMLRTDMPADLPMIESDGERLHQIVGNLVENAVKFTDAGQVAVGVRVLSGESGAVTVRIDVTDTGPGIAYEHRNRIFERFTQVDGSSSRRTGGTGLGLAIARGIARDLGGDVALHSRPEEGSTFTLSLPARLAKASERNSGEDLAA